MHSRNRISAARASNASDRFRVVRKRPDRARIVFFTCLCIAIFDAAHLVYRTNQAPAWFDFRFLIADSIPVNRAYPEPGYKILDPTDLGLDC